MVEHRFNSESVIGVGIDWYDFQVYEKEEVIRRNTAVLSAVIVRKLRKTD
jgi:hypothetical protein